MRRLLFRTLAATTKRAPWVVSIAIEGSRSSSFHSSGTRSRVSSAEPSGLQRNRCRGPVGATPVETPATTTSFPWSSRGLDTLRKPIVHGRAVRALSTQSGCASSVHTRSTSEPNLSTPSTKSRRPTSSTSTDIDATGLSALERLVYRHDELSSTPWREPFSPQR
eukprot:Amastigsp_a17586_6.p2 type:complete len:165 gc:universal Amastigsp_a17586_6:618-124(-)